MSQPNDPRCGTSAGAQAHRRRGEAACPLCRTAAADYHREFRRKTRESTSVLVPIALLRQAAAATPEPLATQLRSLLGGATQ